MSHHPRPALEYLLIVALLLFAGCSQAEPGQPGAERIIGTWINSEKNPQRGDIDTVMSIKADGSFSGSMRVNSENVWTFSGNWTLNGNTIKWEYLESSLALLAEDRAEIDTILSLEQNMMTLQSERWSSKRTLRRVE